MIYDAIDLLVVFVLSVFLGIEVISKVPSILHTPLMSGSNAIHGIILVGFDGDRVSGPGRPADDPGLFCRFPGHAQHRRWGGRHRPHAGHVQGPPARQRPRSSRQCRRRPQAMTLPAMAAIHISADGLTVVYLLSAVCFVLALKALSSPRNARYGNLVGVAGMVVAVALTFLVQAPGHDWVIGAGMGSGALVAVPVARKVPMTGMPQMVAIFNGVGGGAAAVISLSEYLHDLPFGVPA